MLSPSSASAIRLLARTSVRTTLRAPVSRGFANFSTLRNARPRFIGTGGLAFGAVLLASFTLATTHIYADTQAEPSDVVTDPNTSITFPKTMHVPSRVPIPDLSLIGVGVRKVSFLGIKVYSVAFYADLNNPALQVSQSATPEEKIDHIIQNTTCALRIIPTRNTSYSHLRDGFMRALQGRLVLAKKSEALTPQEELEIQSPLRKFKSMFPNSKPLEKHQSLDLLFLAAMGGEPRNLIVRDLGSVQNDWLALELLRAYFHEKGISQAMKGDVWKNIEGFGTNNRRIA
ncbi:chalcone-flavanone isomerase-domain-containing protein [Thelephora terrestris]|uniref:Chalcone-flavanone isomerase-domain-containing protein n=1 Tax=Thelephora terrestris TaxID=56493 RepID=A0A9P6HH63_9AGAM|nr:chalcone-flavanone isomerase-domain-containing protein [Thelephora terrestris]